MLCQVAIRCTAQILHQFGRSLDVRIADCDLRWLSSGKAWALPSP